MNEGIFTASASKQRKIFSQVTKAKKEIFKNASETKPAVKEEKQMPSFQQLRSSLEEKTLTPAEKTKREEIAKAMERETPGMPMAKKMAIATAQAKKVAEGTEVNEAVSVKKEKYSWGTMMTVHHGSDTSYPLHPEHQSAIKKLRPGMKTTFKDETNSTVHAHREGDTVHLTRPKTGSTLTSLPYHHFDTSEHAKPAAKKPAGEYDRKVTDHLKKKYNEEAIIEAYTEDDIANGGTVIYKHDGKHYMAKVSHKTGGGAGSMIHTTSSLGHKIKLNQVVSTDASDWTKYKNIKEEAEQVNELKKSTLGSYVKKAADSATMSAYGAGGESQRHAGEPVSKRPDTYGADRKVALKRLKGIDKATDRLTKEANENPCWDGYKMLGMKEKDGKQVPNCIPEESHYCAKHVYSNMFGEGTVVEGIHAEPDEQGNIEWYAVQFNEGIKKVFTEKLEIMMAEYHGNHNKKKPKR